MYDPRISLLYSIINSSIKHTRVYITDACPPQLLMYDPRISLVQYNKLINCAYPGVHHRRLSASNCDLPHISADICAHGRAVGGTSSMPSAAVPVACESLSLSFGVKPYPGVGVKLYPGVGVKPYPGVGVKPYPGVGVKPYPGISVKPYPGVGVKPYPGVGVQGRPVSARSPARCRERGSARGSARSAAAH